MNTVFIVPTGIGAEIGGYAGDATPAFKLIASVSDIAITHPNVVNASDINEMPENTWYVEGSILDRFLEGQICLEKPKSNRILLAVNKPIRDETINAMNAARHTIGCSIEVMEIDLQFDMNGYFNDDGTAGGDYYGMDCLITQLKEHEYDALALSTQISVSKEVVLNYLRRGGVNPWGGIEAIVSKRIADEINRPVAHAPLETDDPDIRYFNEKVDPRGTAEVLSMAYIHCVFKGLHKAPRISDRGLSVRDIDCLITPINCVGRPHAACIEANIPIIAVEDNKTVLNDKMLDSFIIAKNYLEVAGIVSAQKVGITVSSIKSHL